MVKPDLTTRVGPITLKNPVILASGTCGYGLELGEWTDISQLGGLVLKGLSSRPRPGNPPPRIAETASGLLNSIGLDNVGLDCFITKMLPALKAKKAALIANVYATSVKEFVDTCAALEDAGGIVALELNLSCPNVKAGGIAFGQEPSQTSAVVKAVRKKCRLPLIVKLTPRVTDIAVPARACADSGADAVSVTNTFPGMVVDIWRRRPVLGANFGGLSGPAIKPLALKLVWECCRAVSIPVIGVGGIGTWQDAAEFIIAGAAAVQIGTATLVNPLVGVEMVHGLERFLADERLESLDQLRGTLRLNEV